MNVTTHLQNTITAAIGHMRSTPDFDWDHRIAERVLEVIEQHETRCSFCRQADPHTEETV